MKQALGFRQILVEDKISEYPKPRPGNWDACSNKHQFILQSWPWVHNWQLEHSVRGYQADI